MISQAYSGQPERDTSTMAAAEKIDKSDECEFSQI